MAVPLDVKILPYDGGGMCMPQMQNSRIRIEVDGKTGRVAGIFSVESGEKLVKWPEAVHGAPLRLVCRDKEGCRRVFSPGPATVASAIRSDETGKFTLVMEHRAAVETDESLTPCMDSSHESGGREGEISSPEERQPQAVVEIPLSCSWTVELGEENPEVSTWALSVETIPRITK